MITRPASLNEKRNKSCEALAGLDIPEEARETSLCCEHT